MGGRKSHRPFSKTKTKTKRQEQDISSSDTESDSEVRKNNYRIVKILKKRVTKKGGTEYLSKWNKTWEPLKNLNCKRLIKEYEESEMTKEAKKKKNQKKLLKAKKKSCKSDMSSLSDDRLTSDDNNSNDDGPSENKRFLRQEIF